MSIQKIITAIVLLILAFISFNFGSSLKSSDTLGFCYDHYRNQSFLDTMIGDDPAEVKICASSQWRTGKYFQYCSPECSEKVDECLEKYATKDQIKFASDCHWMGKDYFISTGYIIFGFFIPMISMFWITFMFYNDLIEKEDKNDKEKEQIKKRRTQSL